MKERTVYRETYNKGVKLLNIPKTLPHMAAHFTIAEVHLLASAVVDRDGERLEYQDLRVYVREKPTGP